MAIKIQLKEENNQLVAEDVQRIVCGNSNYHLQIEFSENWQNVANKRAVFLVEGAEQIIPLEENECTVPPMPNAEKCFVCVKGEDENGETLSTTNAELLLLPTNKMTLEGFENYGDVILQMKAEIDNLKEFKENASNPNLLINGDFNVNQRGKTTYSETNKYTVDRWKLVSGSVSVASNGIILSGTIVQKLEHAPDGETTASADTSGGSVTATYANGTFTISTTTPTLIKWVKLEMGTNATPFSPKPYAEELALCQRYYYSYRAISSYGTFADCMSANSTTQVRATFDLPVVTRKPATIIVSGNFQISGKDYLCQSLNVSNKLVVDNRIIIILTTTTNLNAWSNYIFQASNDSEAKIEIDAEFY